jgi:predicted AAA+ superfamily ATPase
MRGCGHLYLEREIYKTLLRWSQKQAHRTALFLRGPRQVGKTYLLEKLAKEEYKHYHLINLKDKTTLSAIESLYEKYSVRHSLSESDGTNYRNMFQELDPCMKTNRAI